MSKLAIASLAAAAVILGAFIFFVWPHVSSPLRTGERPGPVTLPTVDSSAFSFRTGGGRILMVNFWATWCPPCVEETPSLEKFSKRMKPAGVEVLGVSVDQNLPALKKFIAAYGITYPVLRDPHQALASRWGTYKFPETYIFDRSGRLADKVIGASDWNAPSMGEFVSALLHWPPNGTSQHASASSW